MRDHTKIRAFELADDLVFIMYKETRKFPKEEIYSLTSQMRRAAVSVPCNIVEGCARESQSEYIRFLEIAFSSLREFHYQFSIAYRLDYVSESDNKDINARFDETEKVIGALLRSLRKIPNHK